MQGATWFYRSIFSDDFDLSKFDMGGKEGSYREWNLPADLIKANATVTEMTDAQVGEAEERWLADLERAQNLGKFNPAPD